MQGGLLTLPDVPPSVGYPSGRHWQRRGPKPGGQRNLDPTDRPWKREPTRRLPASRRSGASRPGQVNPGEVLIKAVNRGKPKMLSGLDQKVRGQVQGLQCPLSRMTHHRPKGTTLPRSDRRDERSNPVVSPRVQRKLASPLYLAVIWCVPAVPNVALIEAFRLGYDPAVPGCPVNVTVPGIAVDPS